MSCATPLSVQQLNTASLATRNRQLDVLRAIAILMVLAAHIELVTTPKWWETWFVGRGWAGVDLFFVLSGYLISGLLFVEFKRTGGIRFKRFAFRRAMKIWPPLYVLTLGVLLWRLYHDFNLRPFTPFLHDFFFLDSYLPGTYGHFWSLAVEEHFYILLPICLFLMLRAAPWSKNPFRAIPMLFLIVAALALTARIATAITIRSFDYYVHFYPTHLRLDSLMFGVLLGYYDNFHGVRLRQMIRTERVAAIFASISLLAVFLTMAQSNPILYTVGFTLNYLGFGLLMLVFLETALPEKGTVARVVDVFARTGQHSYSIYLWHVPLIYLIAGRMLRLATVWYFIGSLVVGVLMSKLIEIPTLRLRDRLSEAMFSA